MDGFGAWTAILKRVDLGMGTNLLIYLANLVLGAILERHGGVVVDFTMVCLCVCLLLFKRDLVYRVIACNKMSRR